MQPLNDDMDELYRKAAEDYPLDTSGADWNKVLQQLHTPEEDVPVTVKKKDYKKYLWLLLLLPFVFICNRYSGYNNTLPANNNRNGENIPAIKSDSKNADHLNTITEKQSEKVNRTIQKETVTTNTQIGNRQNLQEGYPQSINNGQTGNSNKKYSKTGYNSTGSLTNNISSGKIAKTKNAISQNDESDNQKPSNEKLSNYRSDDQKIAGNKEAAEKNISGNTDNKTTSTNSNNTINTTTTPLPSFTPKEADSSKAETVNTKAAKSISTKKGFYAGVVLGPDYSTIKFQRIKSSGYSVGVLVGYQINTHLAVESGGLWDKKNYYSEGEYFNTSKITLPYNVKIMEVTGSCYMIEIPLNVKYNFKTGKKGNWFVTAGASSYLMKKEDYTYLYNHNSSTYDVYKAYKNSSRNWFSIMNISAGYEHPLNKNTLLRIEPYVKLPLSGVGIGSLPITSTGLYISITRPVLK